MKLFKLTILLTTILISYATFFSNGGQFIQTNAYSGNFYSSIDSNATGNSLLDDLHDLLITEHHTYNSYNNVGSGLYQLEADKDFDNPGNVIDFYTQTSIAGAWNPSVTYNREHVWPKSLSNGTFVESGAGSDLLHIRPTYMNQNSSRSNRLYSDLRHEGRAYETEVFSGRTFGYSATDAFEPIDSVKGDAARIILYVYTHYSSALGTKTNSYTGPLDITAVIDQSTDDAAFDMLLRWHTLDPVDELEIYRNNYAETKIGVRNPFVDVPEFVNFIWGDNIPDPNVTLTHISYSGTPVSQVSGESFNPIGLVFKAHYSDNTEQTIDIDSVTFNPSVISNSTTSVIATYNNISVTINGISIGEPPITEVITITGTVDEWNAISGKIETYYGNPVGLKDDATIVSVQSFSDIHTGLTNNTYSKIDLSISFSSFYNPNGTGHPLTVSLLNSSSNNIVSSTEFTPTRTPYTFGIDVLTFNEITQPFDKLQVTYDETNTGHHGVVIGELVLNFDKYLTNDVSDLDKLVNYILAEDQNDQCIVRFPVAKEMFLTLSVEEQNTFKTSTVSNVLLARNRYESWAKHLNLSSYTNEVVEVSVFNENAYTNAIITITLITLVSVSSIAGYYFNKKKINAI